MPRKTSPGPAAILVSFPRPHSVFFVGSLNPDLPVLVFHILVGRVADDILMAELSLDLAEGGRELLRLGGDKHLPSRCLREPLQGTDDPRRSESRGSFILSQELLAQ